MNFDSMSLDMDADLMELVKNSNEMVSNESMQIFVIKRNEFAFQFDSDDDIDEDASEDETFDKEFAMHKRDYYIKKLKYPEVTPYDQI